VLLLLLLFAGQLYLGSYADYEEMYRLLGQADYAGEARKARSRSARCEQNRSFFRGLMGIRHDGASIATTHIGQVLAGDILSFDVFLGSEGGYRWSSGTIEMTST
jgi:hypothetical protein